MKFKNNFVLFLAGILLPLLLTACAAMKTSSEYAQLEISGNLDQPVFLKYPTSKTLYLDVDCPVIEWKETIKSQIAQKFVEKGYVLASNPDVSDVMMKVMIRKAGELEKIDAKTLHDVKEPSFGKAIAGSSFFTHDAVTTVTVAATRKIIGPVIDATFNSWVYLGALEVDAYIKVQEMNPDNRAESKITDTRATTRARQANLKWEEASETVQNSLVKHIVSALPKRSSNAQ